MWSLAVLLPPITFLLDPVQSTESHNADGINYVAIGSTYRSLHAQTALRTWPEPPIWLTPAWSRLQYSTQLESRIVDHWHTFKLFCIPYSLQRGRAWMASLATTSFHPSHAKSAGSHTADDKWYSWSLVILIICTARPGWTAKFTAFNRIIVMHNDW